jgi:predicted RNase H-like nuclease
VKRRERRHLAGVDGCRGGWIVVHTTRDIAHAQIEFVTHWKEIQQRFDVIAVDMPIGLSESGYRECEVRARKILRPYGSRVFRVPARGALAFAQTDWAGANAWSKHQGYGGISKQAWNIRPKIAEIDGAIAASDQSRTHEAHPELAFCLLNGGRPLVSKHTSEGVRARRRLLRQAGFARLDDWLADRREMHAKPDDILDACALLLTAERIRRGKALSLPQTITRDARGLRMAIRY